MHPLLRTLPALISTCLALFLGACTSTAPTPSASAPASVKSPDGRLQVDFRLTLAGEPRYTILRDGKPVLLESKLGLVRDDADFSKGLKLTNASETQSIQDDYEILTAKRRVNAYRANRKDFQLKAGTGQWMRIAFQVSNDGVAFCYFFEEEIDVHPGTFVQGTVLRRVISEASSFHFAPGTHAWLQPMSVAKSGWEKTNPSYEEYYEKEIPAGTPSPTGAGWVFPALFRSAENWVLLSETGLDRNYCGSRLRSDSPDGEYSIGFADPREGFKNGPVTPESTLPRFTPWRLIVIGSLKTITESTLGIDLALPPLVSVPVAVHPGKAAWSWPLLGDSQTTFDVQKRFVDYAAEMRWRYCLVDALWDKQIGYERMKELVDYARTKGVSILVWYNSNGDWNSAPQTPRDRLTTRESRIQEFDRLKAMGVAGLKIDFFGGDGQSMIGYYHDLLEDSAPYGFAMNFHGATLPRGWQRTYPHLMTVEAIRGLEFVTFEQKNADQEPTHAAMLPFTRNVFDPMDFTPMVLDRINRIERRTTSGFELSLSVLFTSGIQHYAETPEGMARAPDYVREFLKAVPSIWDDVKFIDGYPGKFAVIARKGEGRWYIAGINAEPTAASLALDASELIPFWGKSATLIADGDGGNLSFRQSRVELKRGEKFPVTVKPNGGFVLVIDY